MNSFMNLCYVPSYNFIFTKLPNVFGLHFTVCRFGSEIRDKNQTDFCELKGLKDRIVSDLPALLIIGTSY